jgi:integrase
LNPHITALQAHNIGYNVNNSTQIKVRNIEKIVSDFVTYLTIDERLSKRVAKAYKYTALKYLQRSNRVVSRDTVRNYLKHYIPMKPSTYNNQLKGLRAFIMRYLGRPEIIFGFRKVPVQYEFNEVDLPSKDQLHKAFSSLENDKLRAIFMLYKDSGLRRTELLQLRKDDLDFSIRLVKSKHHNRTKNAGITFYTEETEQFLNKYLKTRNDNKPRLIRVDMNVFYRMWIQISKISGTRIRPQILRKWHATTLGENGCPDRYVDIFQGRAPKTVLAKHYTGKDLIRLKEIYEKFSEGLNILDN